MKRVPKPVFFIVALLILAFSFTAIFGVSYYTGDNKNTVLKGIGDIRWGIDIRGGVEATFKPADNYDASDADLEAAKSIIELRMVSQGITDYELYADRNSDRIIVRFPWKSDEKDFNAVEAIEEISSTAKLTFRPGNSYESTDVGSDGEYVYKTPTGETATELMDGSMVDKAEAGYINENNGEPKYIVSLTLNDQGAKKFAEITQEYLNKTRLRFRVTSQLRRLTSLPRKSTQVRFRSSSRPLTMVTSARLWVRTHSLQWRTQALSRLS